MSFLETNWDNIQPPYGVYVGAPVGGIREPSVASWTHDNAGMYMLLKCIELFKPIKVLEIGTFDGFGTIKIALTMDYSDDCVLYTIDSGGNYDLVGVGKEAVKIDDPDGWERVVERRNKHLAVNCRCAVKYFEGVSREILGVVVHKMEHWDFCFQDSVHIPEFIIEEWLLYKNSSRVGSIVCFDDIKSTNGFIDYFETNEKNWVTRQSDIGHGSFWAERVK